MDSLFSYKNARYAKWRAFTTKKNIVNDMDCMHIANNTKVEEFEPLEKVIIEDVNEEYEEESESLIIYSKYHNLGMILECSNRY